MNFHIINNPEETANFKFEEGKKYLKTLYHNANERLAKNEKMNLPLDNDIPVLDPHFRYHMTYTEGSDAGFYYHLDAHDYYFLNKGKNKNNFKRGVIKRYAVKEDSVINVFFISHPQDSLKSKTYKATRTGIALGNSSKISGIYSGRENPPWFFGTVLNHEVGHVLGLGHAWTRYDGCDDTPVHPNCWDEFSKECNGNFSNNVMDYNKSQMAYTPCQIGKVHKSINRLDSRIRGLVFPDWCKKDTTRSYAIEGEVHWKGGRDINKDIVITKGAELHLHCRLSMARDTKITIEEGGALHLHSQSYIHNSCGDLWQGVEVLSTKDLSEHIYLYGEARMEDTRTSK